MEKFVIPLCADYVAHNRWGGNAGQTVMLPDGRLYNAAGMNYSDPSAVIPASNMKVFGGAATGTAAVKGFTCEGCSK
jgi:hypothetical protein